MIIADADKVLLLIKSTGYWFVRAKLALPFVETCRAYLAKQEKQIRHCVFNVMMVWLGITWTTAVALWTESATLDRVYFAFYVHQGLNVINAVSLALACAEMCNKTMQRRQSATNNRIQANIVRQFATVSHIILGEKDPVVMIDESIEDSNDSRKIVRIVRLEVGIIPNAINVVVLHSFNGRFSRDERRIDRLDSLTVIADVLQCCMEERNKRSTKQ